MNPQYPLVFSTLLIRVAVGVAIVHIAMSLGSNPAVADWPVALFSIGCITLGVILSMTHLGKPQRFLNSFSNPKSMLTMEAYLTPLLIGSMFILAAGSYLGYGTGFNAVGKIATVIFGILLVYVTAKVYHLKARPSWSNSLVVYEFFLSAICMGILGYIGLIPFFGKIAVPGLLYLSGLAMIVLVAEFVVTIYYRHYVKTVSQTASEVLKDVSSIYQFYLWICLGLAIPFVLCAITLFTKEVYEAMVLGCFLSFFLGALFWRVLFFKTATPLKITPDIVND